MASRDFLTVPCGQETLVITCDSIGGIGQLPSDSLAAPGVVVGHFLARVAIMELLSTGAELLALSCTLAISPEDAKPILEGVLAEASLAHASPEEILVITTEKNTPTKQTGVGLTCIGRIKSALRSGLSKHGDLVVALGLPKVGAEVKLGDLQIATIPKLMYLLKCSGVKDVAPVGSKGILYEAQAIAKAAQLNLDLRNDNMLLNKSAGPATAVVFSCSPDVLTRFEDIEPLMVIGELKED